MEKGNIVTFKNEPTKNTPGRPDSWYACTGVIVADNIGDHALVDGSKWCEVLWSNNQVRRAGSITARACPEGRFPAATTRPTRKKLLTDILVQRERSLGDRKMWDVLMREN